MNRTPKYKAWDIQYKKLVNVTMMLFFSDRIEIDHDQNNGEPKDAEHFNLMEFTGQSDNNGKEVYESYLLKVPKNDTLMEGIHQVHYYKDCFVTSSVLFSDLESANKHSLSFIINLGAVVIGNIYEGL